MFPATCFGRHEEGYVQEITNTANCVQDVQSVESKYIIIQYYKFKLLKKCLKYKPVTNVRHFLTIFYFSLSIYQLLSSSIECSYLSIVRATVECCCILQNDRWYCSLHTD